MEKPVLGGGQALKVQVFDEALTLNLVALKGLDLIGNFDVPPK